MIQDNLSPLPFWDSLDKQHQEKWYAYGEKYGLITPYNYLLPFQFYRDNLGSGDGYSYISDFTKNTDDWVVYNASSYDVQNNQLRIINSTGSEITATLRNIETFPEILNDLCYIRIKAQNGTLNNIEAIPTVGGEKVYINTEFDDNWIMSSITPETGYQIKVDIPANTTMLIDNIDIIQKSVQGETNIYRSAFAYDDTTDGWSIESESYGGATLDSTGTDVLTLNCYLEFNEVKIRKDIVSVYSTNNFYIQIIADTGNLIGIDSGDYSLTLDHDFSTNHVYRLNVSSSQILGTYLDLTFTGTDSDISISVIDFSYAQLSVSVINYETLAETDITNDITLTKEAENDKLKYKHNGNEILEDVTDLGFWYLRINDGDIISYSELFNVNRKNVDLGVEEYIVKAVLNSGADVETDWDQEIIYPVPNAGGTGAEDWYDSDGTLELADDWTLNDPGGIGEIEIVTFNDFTGYAQRVRSTSSFYPGELGITSETVEHNQALIWLRVKYRASYEFKYLVTLSDYVSGTTGATQSGTIPSLVTASYFLIELTGACHPESYNRAQVYFYFDFPFENEFFIIDEVEFIVPGDTVGLAYNWELISSTGITAGIECSKVTGDGFNEYAQRVEMLAGGTRTVTISTPQTHTALEGDELRFRYRSSKPFTATYERDTGVDYNMEFDANTGDSIIGIFEIIEGYSITDVKFSIEASDDHDYFEVDEVAIWNNADSDDVISADLSDLIIIEFWNQNNITYTGGELDYSNNYKHRLYICSDIGKPDYEIEEEGKKIDGIFCLQKAISYKVFKFDFLAPEFMTDLLRIVRLHDYVTIERNGEKYDISNINFTPEWQENGDLALETCEFETDTVIKNVGKVLT